MSKTFKTIMKHWIDELKPEGGVIKLPFHIENFCREMDEELMTKRELADSVIELRAANEELEASHAELARRAGELAEHYSSNQSFTITVLSKESFGRATEQRVSQMKEKAREFLEWRKEQNGN